MEGLFENSGAKLRVLAIVNFVMGMIGTVIFAITTSKSTGYLLGEGSGAFIFILIVVFGALITYIVSLFIYSYASIVENIELIRKNTFNSADSLMTSSSSPIGGTGTVSNSQSNFMNSGLQKMSSFGEEDGWICAKCGSFNKPTAIKCDSCGRSRVK